MLHLLSIIAQWLAGFFLGWVGLTMMGSYSRWWLNTEQPGPPYAAGCVFFLIYLAALAAIRWLH